jgi:hypothetical protein
MKKIIICSIMMLVFIIGVNSRDLKTKYDDMEMITTYEAWTDTQINFILCVPKDETKLPFMKFWVEIPISGMAITLDIKKLYTKALAKNDKEETMEINMEGGIHSFQAAFMTVVERIDLDLDNMELDKYSNFFKNADKKVKVRFSGVKKKEYNLLPVQIQTVKQIFDKYEEIKAARSK